MKGNQQTPEVIVNSGPALSPDQLRAQQAETQLILTGVSLADNGKIALMENRSDYSVTQLKIGDAVANGKVVNITLDSLDYQRQKRADRPRCRDWEQPRRRRCLGGIRIVVIGRNGIDAAGEKVARACRASRWKIG